MTAEIKSIPNISYVNQIAIEVIKRATSSKRLMMSTIEHFDTKVYTCNKFSTNDQSKHMVIISNVSTLDSIIH
jgi:hypothetical protein